MKKRFVLAVLICLGVVGAISVFLTDGPKAQEHQADRKPVVRLWDTGKTYTLKLPMKDAWKDRANWVQIPYGKTAPSDCGDLIIENDYFLLFLFTNKDDSVSLMAKLSTGGYKPNEIYKVYQDEKGRRKFGMGTIWTQILKNTPEEIVVKHAGERRRDGKSEEIVTTYRILADKPWLEVRPVKLVNQQGMHGKSRVCAFVKEKGTDFILDSKREPFSKEVNFPAPDNTIGLINFSRRFRSGYDFMWFVTFPQGAEKNPLTYLGFHADPFWEDGRSDRPSVGAQYAYMGEGGVFISVLNAKDNWKREDIERPIKAGEEYHTEFKAPYAGEWKLIARIEEKMEKTQNMVRDPGAENEAKTELRECMFPIDWGCYCGAGSAEWKATIDEAHSGKKCMSMIIKSHDERSISNNAITIGTTSGYTGENAFDAEPNTTYHFSFWIKGTGFKKGLGVFAQGWKGPADKSSSRQTLMTTLGSARPDGEWKQYEGIFRTLPDTRKFVLFIRAYGNQRDIPVGATIWIDDVYIGKASERTDRGFIHKRVKIDKPGQSFVFKSAVDGMLDYIMVYLWDRTDSTPDSLWTPMDAYRKIQEK